ncbi:alpha-E domain-containing protein [Aliiroseovarius sp. PTFE2010]|uniref:alpha-E domain-containing protein n=1 Tax=Aliiroseovarius sp. PTFE2010 TaxID=3417190 RepID=UPI003CF5E8B6
MLGKTAHGLYWLYRYLERAENTARLIATGQRIALTRSGSDSTDEWRSVMQTVGVLAGFREHHDEITKDAAIDWMLRDPNNPSSVRAAIATARHNARLVRTAVTTEVWEAMNGCHMAVDKTLARKVNERDLPGVLGMIRQRTALVRGTTNGTMLRNDNYDFARIGTFLERADNTARILDMKYYVLLPSVMAVGSRLDNVQWETILRSVSGLGGYRVAHGTDVRPLNIAHFLILDGRMPRSLKFCASKLRDNLGYIAAGYDADNPSLQMAENLLAMFTHQDIEPVFEQGLHEYIQGVLLSLGQLGQQIEIDYRFYD